MSINHEAIRNDMMALLYSRLALMTAANGYHFALAHVYRTDMIGMNCEVPSLHVVQTAESTNPLSTERHRFRSLTFFVGYCAAYNGSDPDAEGVRFMEEITRTIGRSHMLTAYWLEAPEVPEQIEVVFEETGSSMNEAGLDLDGRIYGQVNYLAKYETAMNDMRYF